MKKVGGHRTSAAGRGCNALGRTLKRRGSIARQDKGAENFKRSANEVISLWHNMQVMDICVTDTARQGCGKAISPETSAKISFFAFVGTICVCLLHVPWPTNSEPKRLFCLFVDAVCPTALAFFFAFSGYFLARHWKEPGWWKKAVRKRFASLVVPYFILLLAFLCFFTTFAHPDASFFHHKGLVSLLGLVPWDPPRLVPYWFMRCLFVFVLVSPLVVKAVAAGRGVCLLATAAALDLVYWVLVALQVIGMETPRIGSFFWFGFNLDGFVYFTLGVCLAMCPVPKPGARTIRVCGCVAASLVVAYLVCSHFPWSRGIHANAFIAPFLAVFLWGVLPGWKLPALFHGVMFPIYLLHIVILETYCHYRGWSGRGYPECLLILVLIFFLPILVSKTLGRMAPRLSAILFGGR